MDLSNLFEILTLISVFVIVGVSTYTDLKSRKIPNTIPVVGCVSWLLIYGTKVLFSVFRIIENDIWDVLSECSNHLISALIFVILLGLLVFLFNKLGSENKEYFGMGDIKLIFVVGLFLGTDKTLICILAACIAMIIFCIFVYLVKKKNAKNLPFAPFIFIGLICTIFISFLF